jgi:hypothetical protein
MWHRTGMARPPGAGQAFTQPTRIVNVYIEERLLDALDAVAATHGTRLRSYYINRAIEAWLASQARPVAPSP